MLKCNSARKKAIKSRCCAARFPTAILPLLLISALLSLMNQASAPADTNPPSAFDNNNYEVESFNPVWRSHPNQPSASPEFQNTVSQLFLDTPVELGKELDRFVAPRDGIPTFHFTISELNARGTSTYSGAGILTVDQAIVAWLNKHGYGAVVVLPSPQEIRSQDAADLRSDVNGPLDLWIIVPTAEQIRTIGSGDRLSASAAKKNNSHHARILRQSPVQPPSKESPGTTPFFNEEAVNDYVDRLNRLPGRRVDVALSGAENPDEFTLDYLINESKPWYVYAQVSNTGPTTTHEWRERAGVVDNQVTGNDDILNIDAVTDFHQTTDVVGSYEFPLLPWLRELGTDRLRGRVYGSWDQYTAADLGSAGDTFSGEDELYGLEGIANVFQYHNIFVDFVAGARYQHVHVDSSLEATNAAADYLVPYGGLRYEHYRDTSTFVAALNAEWGATSANAAIRNELGRPLTDRDFIVLQPTIQDSFFLEPLLDPSAFAAGQTTLAHEIYFSIRGQYAFGSRLLPQFEETAGGFETVRGYPEAVTAGDSVFFGTIEYRFHLPRILPVKPEPPKIFGEPFRFAPQQAFQRPDWDLILRTFCDAGEVNQSHPLSGELNSTLVGVGIGAELQIRQNIDLRADWGFALTTLPGLVNYGSNRVSFLCTFLY